MLQEKPTPRFELKTIIRWFLVVTPLILAAAALLVGLPPGYRYVERGLTVLVVGALVTAAALLSERAWSESQLGTVIWRIGCVGAWVWVLVAGADANAQRLLWDAGRPPYNGAAGSYIASLGGQLRVVHLALILLAAISASLILRAPSGTDTRTARLLIATAAVAAVAALPSPAFEHLPWAVRVNDALHGAFASLWTGPLVFLLVFVAWARVDRPVRRRVDRRPQPVGRVKDRPFQQGHVRPSSPAYRQLMHATNRFSELALACAVAVLTTGVAMGIGVAEDVAAEDFFADPWGWGLLGKASLGAALVAFGAAHRAVSLKRLNGEPFEGLAKRFVPKRWQPWGGDPARNRTGALFAWLATVEAAVLVGATLVGVAMNQDGPPRPPAVTITSPVNDATVENHLTISGSADLGDAQQLWVLVEDEGAAPPYYLSTDAPIAIDSSGLWESTVTLGKTRCDKGRHQLIAITVPDGFFDDDLEARPLQQYSVRLPQIPENSMKAGVAVTARGC